MPSVALDIGFDLEPSLLTQLLNSYWDTRHDGETFLAGGRAHGLWAT